MKKKGFLLLLGLIMMVNIVSCGTVNGVKDTDINNEDRTREENNSNFIKDIHDIRDTKRPKDLVEYLEEHSSEMEIEELSEAIYTLNTMQKKYLEYYNKEIEPIKYQRQITLGVKNVEEITIDSLEDIDKYFNKVEDENFKNIIIEAYKGNYELSRKDSKYIFAINYNLYEKYRNISPEVGSLIEISSEEQEFLNSREYELKTLNDKLLKLEKHLRNYKDGLDYEELLRIYSNNLLVFLEGDSRIILVDRENLFRPEVIKVYNKISDGDSITGEVVGDYLEELNISGSVLTEEVKNSILGIHNKAIALLEK